MNLSVVHTCMTRSTARLKGTISVLPEERVRGPAIFTWSIRENPPNPASSCFSKFSCAWIILGSSQSVCVRLKEILLQLNTAESLCQDVNVPPDIPLAQASVACR